MNHLKSSRLGDTNILNITYKYLLRRTSMDDILPYWFKNINAADYVIRVFLKYRSTISNYTLHNHYPI